MSWDTFMIHDRNPCIADHRPQPGGLWINSTPISHEGNPKYTPEWHSRQVTNCTKITSTLCFHIWGVLSQMQVSMAGISNYIPQILRFNYLSLPLMPASRTTLVIISTSFATIFVVINPCGAEFNLANIKIDLYCLSFLNNKMRK